MSEFEVNNECTGYEFQFYLIASIFIFRFFELSLITCISNECFSYYELKQFRVFLSLMGRY